MGSTRCGGDRIPVVGGPVGDGDFSGLGCPAGERLSDGLLVEGRATREALTVRHFSHPGKRERGFIAHTDGMTTLCPISVHVSLNVQSRETASIDAADPGSVAALVGRVRSGDRQAAAALLRLMQDRWYRYCLAQLRRSHEAEDATQEVALRVLRGLGRLREAGRFETWSFGVALNVCREARRRGARHRAGDLEGHEPAHTPRLPEDHSRLHDALGLLPPRQREAVTLRYLQGLTIEQTADAMRCRQGTVKAAVHRGLKSMRRAMAEDQR